MPELQNIIEYQDIVANLPFIKPFKGCCSSPLVETIYVEPLAGRNPFDFDRTCIVQCPECKRMYVSDWD